MFKLSSVVLGLVSMLTLIGTAMALNPGGASAQSEGVRWAGQAVPSESFRLNILHAPDTRYATVDPPVTVSSFGPIMRHPGIRNLLGLSKADFARADVIAFEGNGGYGPGVDKGWEGSIWTFADGANTYVATFNEKLGAAGSDPTIVKTGSILGPDGTIETGYVAYSNFFGLCCPDPGPNAGKVVSYILFDLDSVSPAIDTASPNFTIKIENNITGNDTPQNNNGTPDPDAIGILKRCSLATCPVPVHQ